MELEFAFKEDYFTADQMRIVRIFFNVSAVSADEVYELGDDFVMTENSVSHLIGDILYTFENGYLVDCCTAAGNKQFLFQRSREGLLAALLRLVDPEAE